MKYRGGEGGGMLSLWPNNNEVSLMEFRMSCA